MTFIGGFFSLLSPPIELATPSFQHMSWFYLHRHYGSHSETLHCGVGLGGKSKNTGSADLSDLIE